jgi:expansin (peptidoglycan-binding protein)
VVTFQPRRPVVFAAVSAVLVMVIVAGVLAGLGGSGSRAPVAAGSRAAGGAAASVGGAPAGTANGTTGASSPVPPPVAVPAAALGPLRVPAQPGRASAGGSTPAASGQPRASGGVPAGPGRSGRATHYTLTGLGNCSFPTVPADYVALSPSEYAGAGACGTVLDVRGPQGTVRVTVVDLCPECEAGHLDLGVPAFAAIADPVRGIVPVTYTRVVDPPLPGPVRVRIKEGSSRFWLSVLLLDTGNPLVKVEAAAGSGWRQLIRRPYNYWEADAGVGPGPLTVRITDDQGHQRTLTGVPLAPGAIHVTSVRMY